VKYCPNCRDEYREGFTECADCLVPLVDELPAETEATEALEEKRIDHPDLVQVFMGPHPVADQIRAVLEGNGIAAYNKHEGSAAYPVNVGAMGDSRVMVLRSDLEEAIQIVHVAMEGELEISEEHQTS
jgi:hypothetical protein